MPPQSFALKLGRAMEHAQTLDREIRGWIEGEPDLIVAERKDDAEGRRIEWRFRPDVVVDPAWSLLIGDCIHNLRSALDHLALALAVRHSGHLSRKAERTSEFPIFGPRQMTSTECRDRIGCIDPLAQTLIQGLQPHHASPYDKHPLWLIQDLDNVDKHRFVNATLIVSGGMEVVGLVDLRAASLEIDGGAAAEPDAPVAILRFDETADDEMEMGLQPLVHVAFSEGPAGGMPVIDTVRHLHAYVEKDIVGPLSNFL